MIFLKNVHNAFRIKYYVCDESISAGTHSILAWEIEKENYRFFNSRGL